MALYLTNLNLGTPADTQPRLSLQGSATPTILFGVGGATAPNNRILRLGNGSLQLDSNGAAFTTAIAVVATSGQLAQLGVGVQGDTNAGQRVYLQGDASLQGMFLGTGAAIDLRFLRTAAGQMSLDSNGGAVSSLFTHFATSGQTNTLDLSITGDTAHTRMSIRGDASNVGIFMGSGAAADVRIARTAASATTIDANGAAANTTLNLSATAAQVALMRYLVAGDGQARLTLATLINGTGAGLSIGSGTVTDVALYRNAAGQLIFNALGTTNTTSLMVESTSAQLSQVSVRVAGDTTPRAQLEGDATLIGIQLGSGGAAADLQIYRSLAHQLKIDSNGAAGTTDVVLASTAGQSAQLRLTVGAEAFDRVRISGLTSGVQLGPGATAQDIFIYRDGAKILWVDADGLGGSLTTVDFKTTNLYQNGSPITATATQVSMDTAAAATQQYVARIKETGDTGTLTTGYRAFLGMDAADLPTLYFGPGGTSAFDVKLSRFASGVKLSANGQAVNTSFFLEATSGRTSIMYVQVAGDTTPRTVLEGDATITGLLLGPGNAAQDVRLIRSAAGSPAFDSNGAAAATVLQINSTSGQQAELKVGVTGAAAWSASLRGDATLVGLQLGGGAATYDARLARTAAGVVKIDSNSAAVATLVYAEATAAHTATLGIDIAGDSQLRVALDSAQGLYFGSGAAIDLRLNRGGAGSGTYDANGTANKTVFGMVSTSGQQNQLTQTVSGDTNARIVQQGDATITGWLMGPGNATQDVYLRRTGASILQFDSNGAGGTAGELRLYGYHTLANDWTTTLPSVAIGLGVYNRQLGQRTLTQQNHDTLIDRPLGIATWKFQSWWIADGGGTNVRILRGPALTNVGTPTTGGSIATTNYSTSRPFVKNVSAALAGSQAEFREADQRWFLGNAAGMGGFHWVCVFNLTTAASVSDRIFVGLSNTNAALANSDPSSLLNLIGFGCDAADTDLQFMVNDGAGAATKTDLGANFLKATTTNVYEAHIYVPPNSTSITWTIHRLDDLTKAMVTGTALVTNQPAVNTLLQTHLSRWNNATAAACAIGLYSLVVELEG